GGILNDDLLAARFLGVDDFADEDAGVADDEAARLQDQLAVGLLHGWHDHLGEGVGGQRLLLAVMDAEAASHVEVLNQVALPTPAKTICGPAPPAASARYSSPPLVTSKPEPASRMILQIVRFGLVLML